MLTKSKECDIAPIGGISTKVRRKDDGYLSDDRGGTMDFFKWKDSFSIGIEEIDQQHMSFLEYLNECHLKVSGTKGAEIGQSLIDALKVYAAEHFRFEEALMQAKGYPKLETQERQHKYFESQIAELETAKDEGSERTVESLLAFLRDWFLNHILEEDKDFASYVK